MIKRIPGPSRLIVEFTVVEANQDDLDILVRHRLEMWREIHPELDSEVNRSEATTRKWIVERLSEGRMVGFVARASDGTLAGSGCVWVRDEQPRPTSGHLEVPYLMSMYTEKDFRRKGVARLIVQRAVEWCKRRGYDRVILHASEQGGPVYERLGFKQTNEMRLRL